MWTLCLMPRSTSSWPAVGDADDPPLESDLGTELFIRQGRGLVLSPSGVALVAPAREVVRALDVARETVAAVDGLRGGRLRIASMPSQVVSPLTGLVASFVERYPGVQVAIGAAPRSDDVREALLRGPPRSVS